MKKNCILALVSGLACVLSAVGVINGQTAKETFTGTVMSYGGGNETATYTGILTVNITGRTSDEKIGRYLNTLRYSGQDALLNILKNDDLGSLSLGGLPGRTLNVVRETNSDGKIRYCIVFERWMKFAELRGGYRYADYPFGFIELLIDPATGKGDGTYVAAAQIRWKQDNQTSGPQVEMESFATFPARILNVTTRTP